MQTSLDDTFNRYLNLPKALEIKIRELGEKLTEEG
jgi:hypothetical protein